jgi:hypothetical protein
MDMTTLYLITVPLGANEYLALPARLERTLWVREVPGFPFEDFAIPHSGHMPGHSDKKTPSFSREFFL